MVLRKSDTNGAIFVTSPVQIVREGKIIFHTSKEPYSVLGAESLRIFKIKISIDTTSEKKLYRLTLSKKSGKRSAENSAAAGSIGHDHERMIGNWKYRMSGKRHMIIRPHPKRRTRDKINMQ